MSAVEVLEAARALVAKGWTRGWYARMSDGADCDWDSPRAVCWCPKGALFAAAGATFSRITEMTGEQRQIVAECDALLLPGRYLPDWNDAPGRTQAEVLAVFDKAITLARSTP